MPYLIQGPAGYVVNCIGSREISSGRSGGLRTYLHAAIPLDLQPKASPEVRATLKRGVTVRARLAGPDGQPVPEAILSSYVLLPPATREWRHGSPITVRDGQIELAGLDPDKPTPVYVLDPKDRWGAKLEVAGREGPLAVRLLPCGSAEVRFVDSEGRPVAGHEPSLVIVFTPGPSQWSDERRGLLNRGELFADEDFNSNLDRVNYWQGIRSDAQGRCVLPALIPGASYRLTVPDAVANRPLEFVAEAGKTLKLPDVVVKQSPDGRR